MAFDGSDLCWMPDVPVTRDDEWRLRVAQFGDGYSQRTLDGINALNRKWSLVWGDRDAPTVNAIVAFLEAEKASTFPFLEQQTGTTWQVFCDAWRVDWGIRRPGGIWYGSVSAEFVKANGITA
jgi:phage-related protein